MPGTCHGLAFMGWQVCNSAYQRQSQQHQEHCQPCRIPGKIQLEHVRSQLLRIILRRYMQQQGWIQCTLEHAIDTLTLCCCKMKRCSDGRRPCPHLQRPKTLDFVNSKLS